METKDTAWVRPGMSVRVAKISHCSDPTNTLVFSKDEGAVGSVMKVEADYATLYIANNIVKGKPANQKVPLIQCERG